MVQKRIQRGGKIALVLAGGGMTGAVYEIGALRAIDDLLVDRTVNDFDIYVGTSAGAIVASFFGQRGQPGGDVYGRCRAASCRPLAAP
ncbi:MAG: patatin-like phospholipase family protein [Anaerolineae bacterium]